MIFFITIFVMETVVPVSSGDGLFHGDAIQERHVSPITCREYCAANISIAARNLDVSIALIIAPIYEESVVFPAVFFAP